MAYIHAEPKQQSTDGVNIATTLGSSSVVLSGNKTSTTAEERVRRDQTGAAAVIFIVCDTKISALKRDGGEVLYVGMSVHHRGMHTGILLSFWSD